MILDANGMPILQPAVDNAETATFNTAFAAVGTAFSGFTGTRQIQSFLWADNAARTAQTGMVAGDEGYQTDTDTAYRYDGTAWNEVVSESHLQLDTTNSVAKMVTQYGIGKIAGAGAPFVTETVTFPVEFASVPVIQGGFIGARTPQGAFDPVGLNPYSSAAVGTAVVPTTTGLTMYIHDTRGKNLSTSWDFYYSWSATGVLA